MSGVAEVRAILDLCRWTVDPHSASGDKVDLFTVYTGVFVHSFFGDNLDPTSRCRARQNDIESTICKHGVGEIDPHLIAHLMDSLSLRLVDRHGKCELDGEA